MMTSKHCNVFTSHLVFCSALKECFKKKKRRKQKVFLWFLLDYTPLHLSLLLSGPSSHVALTSLSFGVLPLPF